VPDATPTLRFLARCVAVTGKRSASGRPHGRGVRLAGALAGRGPGREADAEPDAEAEDMMADVEE